MKRFLALAALWLICVSPLAAQTKITPPLVSGLKNPESVAVGPDGSIYISTIGEFGKDGDGAVMKVVSGKAEPFATGLDDPKGLAITRGSIFVADKDRIWRIDMKGQKEVFVPADKFPTKPLFLNDMVADSKGNLFVSDSGDLKGNGGAIYRIEFAGKGFGFGKGGGGKATLGKVVLVTDSTKAPALKAPNGLAVDNEYSILVLDLLTGEVLRVKLSDGSAQKIAEGFDGGDGLALDHHGRLFISSWKNGTVHAIPRPGQKPVLLASGFQSAADICLDKACANVLVPDMKAGTLTAISAKIPGWEVDETPLALEAAVAFPNLEWTGWDKETPGGLPFPLRPLLLTHAGDGSNRVFVGIQQGTVHVFPNDQKATKTKVFLDIKSKVLYQDKENETGFLGLAFPPNYKQSGEFYAFYTLKAEKLTNVVSRFRVSKDDPDKADPASEEVLMKFVRPYWNHDGGTIIFGPDGYLYVALGDGGLANDPKENGQNLNQFLGGILRIDVSKKDPGLTYSIPKDNPFVGKAGARPEKWAYGLRNVWRMAFDKKTGKLWAADVGQNLYEEIDIIIPGGNYGWNIREGLHPFSNKGVEPRKDLIEPIWEYDHDLGKSITGGHVYRGKRLPELDGAYLYADYITMFIRALRYDEAKGRVVANQPIKLYEKGRQIMSFGEDEMGEVYHMAETRDGKGIFWFVRSGEKK